MCMYRPLWGVSMQKTNTLMQIYDVYLPWMRFTSNHFRLLHYYQGFDKRKINTECNYTYKLRYEISSAENISEELLRIWILRKLIYKTAWKWTKHVGLNRRLNLMYFNMYSVCRRKCRIYMTELHQHIMDFC